MRDFSLFDRPFLGGIVSLGALSAMGQPPGTLFNNYPIYEEEAMPAAGASTARSSVAATARAET